MINFNFITNWKLLGIVLIVYAILLLIGAIKKKSIFPLILLLSSVACLVIHVIFLKNMDYIFQNVIIDFAGIIVAVVAYIIVDEIEIRREKINDVFKDKYKNK